MRDFAYAVAADVTEAVEALADPDVAVIAGGTELLNWMRLGIATPARLLDIGSLPDLRVIAVDGDPTAAGATLQIGALATLGDVARDPLVDRHAASVAQAARAAASVQVRNRATIGGNVLQRTRCPYFRAETPMPWPCNKRDPGSGCTARDGYQDHHAIFGWTDSCVAVHPSDPAVALAALDAEVEVEGPGGPRRVAMVDLLVTQEQAAAGGDPDRESTLMADELIVGYAIPIRPAARSAYVKVRERASYEYALVSAAATVELGDGVVQRAAIALGSVAQRPWRLPVAEAALSGGRLDAETVREAVAAAMSDARPLPGNGFKVAMARDAAVRAVLAAAASR